MKRYGNMLESDYPYATQDQVCKYDRKKKIRNVRNYRQIPDSEPSMRKALNKGPMYISIAWGTDLFRHAAGIIDPADYRRNYCAS